VFNEKETWGGVERKLLQNVIFGKQRMIKEEKKGRGIQSESMLDEVQKD
jgi:hypothetical protein